MKQFIIILFLLISLNVSAQKSIFSDTTYILELKSDVDSLYNFRFNIAETAYEELEKKYPDHAFTQLYYALILYWKYFPIVPGGEYHEEYTSRIGKAIQITEDILNKDKRNTEAIFFNLMSRMLIMQYYADNSVSSKVVPHLRKAFKMVTAGFSLKDELTDFYFSTGVYNYYREAYPKAHPIYKPVAYFFPEGDKKIGLEELEYNWKNGTFLDAESIFFLVYINLYFEENYLEALEYLKTLNNFYPRNLLYTSYRVQTLLMLKRYDEASVYIKKLKEIKHSNDFFKVASEIYEAVVMEKRDHNYSKAGNKYAKAIKHMEKYGEFADSYKSFAFYGLSRIYSDRDRKKSKYFRKMANGLASYTHINFD